MDDYYLICYYTRFDILNPFPGLYDDDSHVVYSDHSDEDRDEFIRQDYLDEFSDGEGFLGGRNFDARGVVVQDNLNEFSSGRYDDIEPNTRRAVDPFSSGSTRVLTDDSRWSDADQGANVDVLEQKQLKGGETSSNKVDVGIEDKELIQSLKDGFVCAICMLPWTNDGDHAVGCLPCGHLFGMSCITKWLRHKYPGKCPQCNRVCYKNDVRRVYGLPTDEFQEKINVLESKLAEMQLLKFSSGEERAGSQEISKSIPGQSSNTTLGACKGRPFV